MVTKNQLIENGTNAYCGPLYMAEQYAAGNCPLSSVQASITNVMDTWADPAMVALYEIAKKINSYEYHNGASDFSISLKEILQKALKQYNK